MFVRDGIINNVPIIGAWTEVLSTVCSIVSEVYAQSCQHSPHHPGPWAGLGAHSLITVFNGISDINLNSQNLLSSLSPTLGTGPHILHILAKIGKTWDSERFTTFINFINKRSRTGARSLGDGTRFRVPNNNINDRRREEHSEQRPPPP